MSKSPPHLPHLIDTHAHLDYPPMADDLPATLARAVAAGVERIIHIGCSRRSVAAAVALAEAHPGPNPEVYAAIGVHPHEADTFDDAAYAELAELARSPRVVAIGESGLDYHYDRSPRQDQRRAMARHLQLAAQLGLPIVLHIRDAHEDALALVDADPPPRPGVIHCFTGTAEEAHAWLDRGFFLSFSGIATFPSAVGPREAARICPRGRLLVETDAPYLAPVPMRGRKNEPAYVAFTCAQIAALRGQDPLELAREVAVAAARAFRLPLPPGLSAEIIADS